MKAITRKYFVSERAAMDFVTLMLSVQLKASGLTPAQQLRVLRKIAESVTASGSSDLRFAPK